MFLKLLGEVIHLVFKNNSRISLDSKSEKFKIIEAQQKARFSYKEQCIPRTWLTHLVHAFYNNKYYSQALARI